jgi:integrase
MFGRTVWEPARSKVFPRREDLPADDPRQPKLSRLRRHDLRHAACSWWLREGVDAVVCQRWSGHRTLSVFLDVYQGVAPGREDEGVERLVRSLEGLPTT